MGPLSCPENTLEFYLDMVVISKTPAMGFPYRLYGFLWNVKHVCINTLWQCVTVFAKHNLPLHNWNDALHKSMECWQKHNWFCIPLFLPLGGVFSFTLTPVYMQVYHMPQCCMTLKLWSTVATVVLSHVQNHTLKVLRSKPSFVSGYLHRHLEMPELQCHAQNACVNFVHAGMQIIVHIAFVILCRHHVSFCTL